MRTAGRFFLIVFLGAFMLLPSCEEDTTHTLPGVTTIIASKIFERSALTGGYITSEGGSPIIAKGVCWGTSKDPTIADSHDDHGPGKGTFESILIGLEVTTFYYVRAYATNAAGTAYGEDVEFKTLTPLPPVESESMADQQGTVYLTKKIGTQTWMAQNLRARIFRDGSQIPIVRDNSWYSLTTPACSWVVNDDSRTAVYGLLYNFYVVTDARNICPDGWHMPTLDEWKTMINALGGNDVAGGKMKEAGTNHWIMPNEGASNSSGFTALPAGIRTLPDYQNFTITGYFWSSTSLDPSFGQIQSVRYSSDDLFSDQYPKTAGASVRCVKD